MRAPKAAFRPGPWVLAVVVVDLLAGCRVEWGTTGGEVCTSGKPEGTVLIYTSMYRHVVEALEAAMREDLPAIRPQWYQAGSEKVAARLDAELAANACPADILATSDPAHFARLKKDGRLLARVPVAALRVPRALVDPDGAFVTMRLATMALAFRADLADPPTRWSDLWSPRFAGEAVVGDPLASGTYFTSLAILELVHGPGFFKTLRDAQLVATGGNSAVQEKLLSKEKRAGMLLLENVLTAQAAGDPIAFGIPEDGVVLVPGPVAILSTAPHPNAAALVEDWMLSERAQRIVVDVGRMHAARDGMAPPKGAPPLDELMKKALRLEPGTWEALRDDGAAMKARFGAAYGR